ncbi:patatin-like phospholipase family protein [Actinomadura sp. HBU206391]|uniref:patatin-like phospholipase family protein n=1 Tax=Actinomadura sp. HBU206391 TaxID=2731692 RepID=UPI00164FB5E7|nr:patatin-like phospholipase family protein [Actinomadura sp. HBU206391]MBC6458337.1 patatin-like phospholipase family protein [Actinomadura sp. HBU206391]
MKRRALVLGGGGLAGIAWETGILTALADAGADVLGPDLVVGTSAGSTVGAQVTSGLAMEELFQRQVDPALQTRELPADLDLAAFTDTLTKILAGARDPIDVRRRIGAWALETPTVTEAERRAVVAARLPSHTWPRLPLALVAVDANTGETRVFDAASGADLVDAVAASCAVPGTWPPVTIGDRRYIDGGVRSNENAHLAAGYDQVLVLSPQPPGTPAPPWGGLDDEVDQLRRRGTEVTVVRPDEGSVAAMGLNPLDPVIRAPTAHAGREQGRREAARVTSAWG